MKEVALSVNSKQNKTKNLEKIWHKGVNRVRFTAVLL